MSPRRALWSPTLPAAAADGQVGREPAAAPTAPPVAPGPALPARSVSGSAIAAQVKLARLADLHAQLAQTYRELSEIPLPLGDERALMCNVEKPNNHAQLMSVRDVAERLSLSERTVRRLRRRGVLPLGIEVAGVVRWRPEEIDAWVASGGRP